MLVLRLGIVSSLHNSQAGESPLFGSPTLYIQYIHSHRTYCTYVSYTRRNMISRYRDNDEPSINEMELYLYIYFMKLSCKYMRSLLVTCTIFQNSFFYTVRKFTAHLYVTLYIFSYNLYTKYNIIIVMTTGSKYYPFNRNDKNFL